MRNIKLLHAGFAVFVCFLFFSIGCDRSPQAKVARLLEKGKKERARRDYTRALLDFRSAARTLPKNAEAVYEMGVTYMEIGDVKSAAAALLAAVKIDPKFTPAQMKLTELMALDRDMNVVREAEKRAQQFLATEESNAEALALLAFSELRLGETDTAEDRLQKALRRFPKYLNSSILLAGIKLQKHDLAGAEAVLKDAVEKDPKSAPAHLALGQFYVMSNRMAEAETQVGAAIQIAPDDPDSWREFYTLQMRQGRYDQAEKSAKKLSELGGLDDRFAYASFLLQQRRYEPAITEFRKVVKQSPNDRDARTRLVGALLTAKQYDEAEKILTEALKKNKKDMDALLQRSEVFMMAGKFSQAQADLINVMSFRPDWADAHYVNARVYQAQGAYENRRHELSEAVRLDPNLLVARVDLAESLIRANDARAALDLMNATPAHQRDLLQVIVQRNWALLALKDTNDLKASLDQVLAKTRTPDLLLQSAYMKLLRNDVAGAQADLQESLTLNPQDTRALDLLARSYGKGADLSASVAKIQEYAAKHKDSAQVQQVLGMWLLRTGDKKGARQAFEQAKKLNPITVSAEFLLAEMDATDHNTDSARKRLMSILAVDQKNVDARLLLGLVEEAGGNFPAAVDAYRKVVEAEPDNFLALNNLAYGIELTKQNSGEALKYAQKAFDLQPNNGAVEDTLGWALYNNRLYGDAVQHLKKAASKDRVPVRLYHLAMAYAKAGDNKAAFDTYQMALKLNPSLPEAAQAQEVLTTH